MIPNGYIAIVESEPIIGIPSRRMYGPFETSDEAWAALDNAGVIIRVGAVQNLGPGWSGAGVLPIRPVNTLLDERP